MNKILTGLVSLFTLCQVGVLQAQTPRLVLLITVEELRSDLLQELSEEMPHDGLNRLLTKGRVYQGVYSPLRSADATASEAIIHTGALASATGVSERQPTLKERSGRRVPTNSVFQDKNYLGYATSGNYSPSALTSPTIGDNLKRAYGSKSLVYSIAPRAEEAIIGAGIYGDAAYWIDGYSARWASSTYYSKEFPWYIDKSNTGAQSLPARLSNGITWQPLSTKTGLPLSDTFKHQFRKSISDIADFKDSPLVNDEVVSLARKLFESTQLGKDETPDLLALHLTVGNANRATQDLSRETIESYFRLDRTIASLLQLVDIKSTLVILTGNGMSREYPPTIIDDRRLFKPERCLALVNMYLHAEYGVQGLVEEITPTGSVYLNREVIKNNPKLQLKALQSAVSDFLLEFSGIAYAIEEHRLRDQAIANSNNATWLTALNSATNANRPDVVFGLLPSWIAQDLSTERGVAKYQMTATPTTTVIMYPSIEAKKIDTPLDLREVSTKIAWILRIRPPTPSTILSK